MAIPNTGEGALILSFFFHGRGSELQKTPLGLFRSLFHQLLRRVPEALTDLVDTFQQRCETIGKPGEEWQWHPRELQRFFESSLLKVLNTCPVWLLVDALDECGEENAVNLAEEFKSLLRRLPPSGLKHFHICFTCRHYPILDLDGAFEVYVEKENQKDISTFVQDKLSSFRGRTSSTIPELITKCAGGVFLWAWLVVKQVLGLERKGAGLKEIEAEIRSVPQELDTLYRELIRVMSPDSLKLMQWICFATRPLSLDELRWAMVIEADCRYRSLYECQQAGDYPSYDDGMKRRVQTLSCGLAEVTLSSGNGDENLSEPDSSSKSIDSSIRTGVTPSSHAQVVQFIHQSVKDFFVEKGLSDLDYSVTSTDTAIGMAHFRLSRICIRYLAMEEIDRSINYGRDKLTIDFPFLHYATTSWVKHTKQSDARSISQEDLLEYFAGPSNTLVERWVRIYRILETYSDDCPAEGTSVVHVMSRYGVAGVLWAILERADQAGINIDAKDSHGRTPLWWAAENGHEAVVRLLLKRCAYTDAADKWGRTPLLLAAANGHEAIVRLLVDRGAHTDAADKWGRTPLLLAAGNGHEAIVRLLLDLGAHTEAVDEWGRTLLSYAAERGHEAIVRLLLDRGAHTDAADEGGRTPLSIAAANGHGAVVRLLLERGAHTDAADKWGSTPLWRAAENGHGAVVRLLLDRGARTEAADKWGSTPLSIAAASGHEAVMRLLLERGAYTDAADKWGSTPLSYAAANGHGAVVRLLLERGAYTDVADKWDRRPLLLATGNGHEAIVRLLVDRGAHTDAADKWGSTPLSWAAANGYKAIVRLLLDGGAHTEAADKWGRTPLSWAAANGHEAVVRLLLDRGAHIEAPDMWGRTPLSYAAEKGREAAVRLLQFHGAQLSSTTSP
ncbi:NACHT domain-containing protein [Fusarium falciforme]|uniref:NACHT domain-containing protein n=1 Tax=Fusarium falciforme TaxID=195108 RepID=UPI0023016E12|nr:NACHT domain-containing protein [Fusarium falciforme]WAO96056.1 NACHT domain-containing protein [Fusarium falciforme]